MRDAEDCTYWRTGRSSPDTWIDKAKRKIESVGGQVTGEAFASTSKGGAFVLAFSLDGDNYRVEWPVLKSASNQPEAARRQAATMLYHEVKSRCVSFEVLGARVAFLPYLVLPGGETVSESVREHGFGRKLLGCVASEK